MKRFSEYERTGKLQRKIDVEIKRFGTKEWQYLHSTNWHRTCKDAILAAKLVHGAHHDYRATFDPRKE